MKRYHKFICSILTVLAILLSSCDKHKNDEPQIVSGTPNVTLIYAVNHNNLASDLISNRLQIIKAAPQLDPENDVVLLYSYENGQCTLKELVFNQSGNADFKVVKSYETGVLSTNPARIKEVMDYVAEKYTAQEKTLFLWGHGLGPVNPNKYSHLPVTQNAPGVGPDTPEDNILYSFGGEYVDDITRTMDYVDLDLLADAIPDNVFRTIWFDCCYMASVEIAYQLRNKCRYFVAYPTEISVEGLPYDKVIPLTVGGSPVLELAASQLYEFYNSKSYPVTVSVMDLDKIESFADAVRKYVSALKSKPSYDDLVNYSRLTMPRPNRYVTHPYYDLMGWLENGVDKHDTTLSQYFNDVKNAYVDLVLYTVASGKDFDDNDISPAGYFGISFYPYNNDNSQRDDYYRKLDWWKEVASHYSWL